MAGANPTSAAEPLTVNFDVPSAQVLADQAAILHDLQFVMECCKRLLTELEKPAEERDAVVPLALWSSALVSYGRCFSGNQRFGLTEADVSSLPLRGEVVKYHKWVLSERNKLTKHSADPFEAAKVGAALTAPGAAPQRVEGVSVLSLSRVLVDLTGVRQLGGLASELAKQTADQAKTQQDAVLADAQRLGPDELSKLPPLQPHAPDGEDSEDGEDS
jgi:hypothetical protein